MTESPGNTIESADTVTPGHSAATEYRDRRTRLLLAWVGIVAGVVFTVAVILFSGFALGRASGHQGWHRGYSGGQTGAGCPMMRDGSMMGPGGMMGPGRMDPDDMGPGMMRPGQSPTAVPSPAVPAPR